MRKLNCHSLDLTQQGRKLSLTLQAGFEPIHKFLPTTLNSTAGEPPVKDKIKDDLQSISQAYFNEVIFKMAMTSESLWLLQVQAVKQELAYYKNIYLAKPLW